MVREFIGALPSRKADSHKGDFGRVFIVAGSKGMTGAAYLAAMGALRAGSGLVTLGIRESLNDIMEIKLTEAITLPLPEKGKGGPFHPRAEKVVLDFASRCDSAAVGPGLGRDKRTFSFIRNVARNIRCPLVLDADGVNAFEGKAELLARRRNPTVITPHPGEMARLIGKEASFVQSRREKTAREVAKKTKAVVCLKGHNTVVADPRGRVFVNTTGNSGMSTGGTGDVLTGMIASFIGQGVDLFSAAVNSVYLHGLAGDIAAEKKGPFSLIASDLLEYLPEAFKRAGL